MFLGLTNIFLNAKIIYIKVGKVPEVLQDTKDKNPVRTGKENNPTTSHHPALQEKH